jgi:phage-related protein (TIGR01555 family)
VGKYDMKISNPFKRSKVSDSTTKNKFSDGFANFVSRQGYGADNMLTAGVYTFDNLTNDRLQLEAMYRQSWIVGAAVDSVAEDMTREGIVINSTNEPDEVQKMTTSLSRLGIWRSILEAIKWGRLYGGAIAVLNIDGQDPTTPLDVTKVGLGQFSGLTVYDRWQLQVDNQNTIETGPDAGLPAYYSIVSNISTGELSGLTYHHSRVIRLIGIQLPTYQAISEQMWGESIIERMKDRLVSFDTATMGTANLVQKAYYRTVKIEGLRQVLSSGGQAEENLLKQFDMMRFLQNSEGLSLIDSNDEFESHSYSFAGLSDVILQFGQQISGATGIPLVRLFGQSPAGLNSTGESDFRMYYDNIKAQQESRLRDGLMRVLQTMHQSLFGRETPDDFDFEFVSLWQTTDREKAEISSSIVTQTTLAYDHGVIDLETALQELRQASDVTGIFTNITDQQIEEAKDAPPPPAPDLSEDLIKQSKEIEI